MPRKPTDAEKAAVESLREAETVSPRAYLEERGLMADHHSRAVYVISVAAELAGVHPQTLRIYERKGLLDPARTAGGNRRYSDSDLDRLRRIAELTDEGLNLAGVRRVLGARGRDRPPGGRPAPDPARRRRAGG